jgi:molecular chaperone DnaK (HSP70)
VGNLSSGTGMGARDAVATTAHSALGGAGNVVLPQHQAKRPILMDVNPATLAIHTAGGFTERLLDKNSPIPIERSRVFTTSRDNQTRVEIDCCRGENRRYTENEPLGRSCSRTCSRSRAASSRSKSRSRRCGRHPAHSGERSVSGAKQEAHLQVLGAPVEEA